MQPISLVSRFDQDFEAGCRMNNTTSGHSSFGKPSIVRDVCTFKFGLQNEALAVSNV